MKKLFLTALLISVSCGIYCQNTKRKKDKAAIETAKPAIVNETISVDDFQKKITETKNIQIIDVRTPEEYNEGHVKDAININFKSGDFNTRIEKLDKSKTTLVYCLGGGRSSDAAAQMQKAGFTVIYKMQGGMLKWNEANKPVSYPGSALDKPSGMSLADYDKLVTSDKYVLVDFTAKWCGPCKKMLPMIHKVCDEKKEKVTLVEVDADINKNLLKEKGIGSIPHLELYLKGKLVWKNTGFIDEETFLRESKL